eukprot:TRINITY_DN8015_c2_g1_i1.p2 TRINITY_DN8015_c2_g1~~TRINITY_DN8015_c2_g1_i1.p2  ORF type:complete len:183 (-),score=15.50 TRINITY_DN8015_c2_g1_i1:294-842(-)
MAKIFMTVKYTFVHVDADDSDCFDIRRSSRPRASSAPARVALNARSPDLNACAAENEKYMRARLRSTVLNTCHLYRMLRIAMCPHKPTLALRRLTWTQKAWLVAPYQRWILLITFGVAPRRPTLAHRRLMWTQKEWWVAAFQRRVLLIISGGAPLRSAKEKAGTHKGVRWQTTMLPSVAIVV